MRFPYLIFYAPLSFGTDLSFAQNPNKSGVTPAPRAGTPPVGRPQGRDTDSSRKERIMFGRLE